MTTIYYHEDGDNGIFGPRDKSYLKMIRKNNAAH
jgi:hypothetical protein